jgi:hypothetical protein
MRTGERSDRRPGGTLGWRAHGPGEAVPTPYAVIDVDAFHDALDATATTR